jgi:hypothetical protein
MCTEKLWKQLWLLSKWPKLAPTLEDPKSNFGSSKVFHFSVATTAASPLPTQTQPLSAMNTLSTAAASFPSSAQLLLPLFRRKPAVSSDSSS